MEEKSENLSNDKNTKTNNKSRKKVLVGITIFIVTLMLAIAAVFILLSYKNKQNEQAKIDTKAAQTETVKSEYEMSGNSIQKFDLQFMKIENAGKNMVYSPLSIKYALGMLADGAVGEAKSQITSLIGSYKYSKYENSKNMSMANAMFIRETFKDSVKQSYTELLKEKYGADIIYDSFKNATNINKWVASKTLDLLPSIMNDTDVSDLNFALVNALGIDMEWEHKFLSPINLLYNSRHEKDIGWYAPTEVVSTTFKGSTENISALKFESSFNKYDIIKTLGEENIKNTVKAEYIKWAKSLDKEVAQQEFKGDLSDANINKKFDEYFETYIKELGENYGTHATTTDFEFYTDDNIKCFAKDLKEYDSTTLQYIAIMPVNEELDSYVSKVTEKDIASIISNLTSLDESNFKEGYYTHITGFIPKFKFDYELNLKEDLQNMGIKNVFESGVANLDNITSDKSQYIAVAKHKSNIELTQDGIKAAASTAFGGFGGGGSFDYLFEVPTITIDLTFDKPYMFLIRNKKTSEVWFAGTVYNPLLFSEDTQRGF